MGDMPLSELIFVYAGGVSRPEPPAACLDFVRATPHSALLAWGVSDAAVSTLGRLLGARVTAAPSTWQTVDVLTLARGMAGTLPVLALFGPAKARDVLGLLETQEAGADEGVAAPPVRETRGQAEAVPIPEAVLSSIRLEPADLDLRREAILFELGRLYDLTGVLRVECPWDRKQTQEDIVSYTLEETYELVDAVRARPVLHDAVREELGDLLFQVYFLAVVAEQAGRYDLGDVAEGIHRKLVRRHPHIFDDVEAETPEAVKRNWEEIKRTTEGREGIFHEVPEALPGLLYAQKLQQRAAEVGFDWDDLNGPLEKVAEELSELHEAIGLVPADGERRSRVAAEIGDMLFAVVNVARSLKADPELALRESTARFRARVEGAARLALAEGRDFATLGLHVQETYYQRAKAELDR